MQRIISILFILALFCSCSSKHEDPQADINYVAMPADYSHLPKGFPELSKNELAESWGKEFFIAMALMKDADYYRAITTFKRALILMPKEIVKRRWQTDYNILLCYALAKKYPEVIVAFRNSSLRELPKNFPTYKDLLLILYEAYKKEGLELQANKILSLINKPDALSKLQLSKAISSGEIEKTKELAKKEPSYEYIYDMMDTYQEESKSVATAQALNAVLPGAGYFYVGQKRSGITAFLLNTLFIAAAYHFFDKGNTAAGIITTSLELGWYVGGIFGAGKAARNYNNILYEKYAEKILTQEKLFPLFMLEKSF